MKSTTQALDDRDFDVWPQENARLIREGRLGDCDFDHIAEEIESMGASERRQLTSRLEVLLMHVLKWQDQRAFRGRSWELGIKEQRRRTADHLADNPRLKSPANLDQSIRKAYRYALIRAELETGLPQEAFPPVCPDAWVDIMDEGYCPQ